MLQTKLKPLKEIDFSMLSTEHVENELVEIGISNNYHAYNDNKLTKIVKNELIPHAKFETILNQKDEIENFKDIFKYTIDLSQNSFIPYNEKIIICSLLIDYIYEVN